MVDYSAHIRFDSGSAMVETGENRYRRIECGVNNANQSCPTELILGALGS